MIRVLTLSSLFPDATRPVFGPFVERQTLGIAAHKDVELQVVAPLGVPPWPLSLAGRYAPLRCLPAKEIWKGLTVHRPRFRHWPALGARLDGVAMAKALLPVLAQIRREFAFDLIDAQFFYPDGAAAIRLGEALDVPVSIKARGSDIHVWGADPQSGPQVVDAGQRADGVLAVSAALKRDMVALGMPEDRITVHYTGVDLDAFQPADRRSAKSALGISGPLITSVGSIIARKGHPLVIEALTQLPGVQLVLIGSGPERGEMEALAAEMGVADRVRFTGSIAQTEAARWVAASDVMALPSASEGLANAWLEALACGTPIVIADVGGACELLNDPAGGYVVERSSAAVAGAIAELIKNPRDPATVRALAERFTWDRNTQTLYEHFKSLLRRGV